MVHVQVACVLCFELLPQDLASTLWGFQNGAYQQMITRSLQLLTQKLDAFQAQQPIV